MSGHVALSSAPRSTMAVLMLSVFTVSMGFGIVLPALPFLIEQLLGIYGDVQQVARATGLLTGLYTLSLFLFASAWGRVSDRVGRRRVLLIGLMGFSATSMTFAFVESLPAIYAERFFSGMFAAAVTPVALAAAGDLATTEAARARCLTFVSLAGVSGFLLGPTMGVLVSRTTTFLVPAMANAATLAIPLAGTAAFALLVALATVFTVPGKVDGRAGRAREMTPPCRRPLLARLVALSFIASAGVGVFEVGLALRAKQELGLSQSQIAIMFTECSLVMLAAQAIVFSSWIRPETTRWLILPAFAILAAGLSLVPYAFDFTMMLVVTGAVAASAGILSPILTYWISTKAGKAQGAQLGHQTAAASLGASVGAAAGGVLFNVAWLPNASFVLVAAVIVLGAILSVRLPRILVEHEPADIGNRRLSRH